MEHGGRVLNCAIDKYVYVIVKQRFDDDIYVNYSKKEIVSRVEDLEHELVREAMQMTGVTSGVEITTLADIPSAGSGLGSSSAVTVGLLHALFAYTDGRSRPRNWPSGPAPSRSSAAASRSASRTSTSPPSAGSATSASALATAWWPRNSVCLPRERRALQQQVMLFYTGITRSADSILAEQNANVEATRPQLDLLRDLAGFAAERLRERRRGRESAPAMRESWEAKRKLASGVSNDQIDQAVTRALDAGASGAKLTGAGGGGFLLVICPVERQRAVRESLADMRELPVGLDRLGSRVVLNVLRDIWS